jgi:hypothetical protein
VAQLFHDHLLRGWVRIQAVENPEDVAPEDRISHRATSGV